MQSSNSKRMDNVNHTSFQNIVILCMVIRLLSSQLWKLWKFMQCSCACTIATIFVERGQATNVYPPREFSDNERHLTMMAFYISQSFCFRSRKYCNNLKNTNITIEYNFSNKHQLKNHIQHIHYITTKAQLLFSQTFIITFIFWPSLT